MTKKILGMFLALVLVFGGIASAGELGFHADLVPANETATFRGVLSGFYGEIEVGDMVNIVDEGVGSDTYDGVDYVTHPNNTVDTDIVGTNIGIKLETEDPFYGVGQINFGAKPLNSEGDVIPYKHNGKMVFEENKYIHEYEWGYQAVEIGGGAEIQAFGNVNVGVEATLVNENPADLSEYSPNFSVFASLDFAAFPSPKLEME